MTISETCRLGKHTDCTGTALTDLDKPVLCDCSHHFSDTADPRLTPNQVIYPPDEDE